MWGTKQVKPKPHIMKKSTLFVAAIALSATTAFGQLTSKDGTPILPEAGDYAIGVDAYSFLSYFGNMANGNLNNQPFGFTYTNPNAMITGKMFTSETQAYRVALRIGFGSSKYGNYVTKNGTISNPPELVSDEMKSGGNFIGLGGGMEWRRGAGRLQGYYGGMLLFMMSGGKDSYTYGNAIDLTYQMPVTSDFTTPLVGGGFASGPAASRLTEVKYGSEMGFGLRGFVGAEYFILPKLSIGGEFGWGLMFSSTGEGTSTSEFWDAPNNKVGTTTTTTAKSSMFGFDTDDSAFGVAPASVLIHFHF